MKKYFKFLPMFALFLICMSINAFAFTMYAPDGRTIDVPENEVSLWQSVGWYTAPVSTIYAPDGRAANVAESEKEAYLYWGWYAEPVRYMYAPDGRAIVIKENEADAYKNVGWYTEPVSTMYSLDGRIIVIAQNEVDAYIEMGWYTAPVTYIYSYDGRCAVVYRSDVEAYEDVGWYELHSAYCDKIREYAKVVKLDKDTFIELNYDDSSINSLMVSYTIFYGGAIEYTLFDVDQNGIHELIFSKDGKLIDIYTLNGDNLVKLYEDCYFGERSRLHILYDGSLLSEGSGGASTSSYKLHKISGSGYALVKQNFCYYDGTGKKSYMEGFEYVSPDEYQERLGKYLSMSIYDIFIWNELFE